MPVSRPPSASSSVRELSPVARAFENDYGPPAHVQQAAKPDPALHSFSRFEKPEALPAQATLSATGQTPAPPGHATPVVLLARLPLPARTRLLDLLARGGIKFEPICVDGSHAFEATIRFRSRVQSTELTKTAGPTVRTRLQPTPQRAQEHQQSYNTALEKPALHRRKSQPDNVLQSIDDILDFISKEVEAKGPELVESGLRGCLRLYFAAQCPGGQSVEEACEHLIAAISEMSQRYAAARIFKLFCMEEFDAEDLCFLLFARQKVMKDAPSAGHQLRHVKISVERVRQLVDDLFGADAPFLKDRIVRSLFRALSDRRSSISIGVSASTTIGTSKEPAIDVDAFLETTLKEFHAARFQAPNPKPSSPGPFPLSPATRLTIPSTSVSAFSPAVPPMLEHPPMANLRSATAFKTASAPAAVSRERVALLRAQFSAHPQQSASLTCGGKRVSAPAVLASLVQIENASAKQPEPASVEHAPRIPTEELLLEPEANEAVPAVEALSLKLLSGEAAMDAKEHTIA